jgi:hypothetical protein
MAGRDDTEIQALERLLRENRPLSALGSLWFIRMAAVVLGALRDEFVAVCEPACGDPLESA